MGRPTKRRPRRIHRWAGRVDEVEGGSFWALLEPVGHKGPEIVAEFDLKHLPTAMPGVVFNLYTHRRGRKVRTVLRERVLPPFTAEELDRIWDRAHSRAEQFQLLAV